MRTFTASSTAAFALVAVALAGCSSGSKSSTASSAKSPAAPSAAGAASTTPAAATGGSAGTNACSLLSVAKASTLTGHTFTSSAASTIAAGQDACTYLETDGQMLVIVYQPNSGVSLDMLKSTTSGTSVGGVGDKAVVSDIELDVQTGQRLIAVQGAGGTPGAIAVAKALIAAL
jgi:hypothetical protein